MNRALGAILLLLLGLALASAVRDVWTIDPDAAAYVALGRSLAEHGTYSLDGIPHAKYPPGLPALLGLLMRLAGPEAWAIFHLALVAAVIAAVWLSWALARHLGAGPIPALTVAACTGLSQSVFDLSVIYLRSEALFLALTLAALLASLRAMGLESRRRDVLIAAVLTAAAVATRLAGVALAAVAIRTLLARRTPRAGRLRALVLVLVCAGAAAGWQLRGADIARQHPGASDYSAEFFAAEARDLTKVVRLDNPPLDLTALGQRVAGNTQVMMRAFATLLTNVDRAAHRLPVGAALLGLVLAGLATLARRGGAHADMAAYAAAMLGLYLLWPFHQQERFYVPLLPLLLLAAGEGLVWLRDLLDRLARGPTGRRLLLAGGIGLLVVLGTQRSDHPALLGRYSLPYAALLVGTLALELAIWRLLRSGRLMRLPGACFALAAALFVLPFSVKRLRDWPARVVSFEARRQEQTPAGPLARIEVHPVLEEVALWLVAHTPEQAVVMTDVPKMMSAMTGRRCVPFVYRLEPPQVVTGDAELVFYTREIAEAAQVMDTAAPGLEVALQLEPVGLGTRQVRPTVYRVRR